MSSGSWPSCTTASAPPPCRVRAEPPVLSPPPHPRSPLTPVVPQRSAPCASGPSTGSGTAPSPPAAPSSGGPRSWTPCEREWGACPLPLRGTPSPTASPEPRGAVPSHHPWQSHCTALALSPSPGPSPPRLIPVPSPFPPQPSPSPHPQPRPQPCHRPCSCHHPHTAPALSCLWLCWALELGEDAGRGMQGAGRRAQGAGRAAAAPGPATSLRRVHWLQDLSHSHLSKLLDAMEEVRAWGGAVGRGPLPSAAPSTPSVPAVLLRTRPRHHPRGGRGGELLHHPEGAGGCSAVGQGRAPHPAQPDPTSPRRCG